ncbi:MAG: WxcM-like domain-containing protein [Candidatus Cloacimonetes bacterium]|nr:WxcM-like domain-containing protein [Candidatus Cloacimonadota bacterium]
MITKWYDLQLLGDDRGSLVAIESTKTIPFETKRVYYIFNTKAGIRRGFHAHKELKQAMVCVSGSCKIELDDGQVKEIAQLDASPKALAIDPMIWHEMYDFSEDCVLIVLASEHYDESDYIRNYDSFIKEAANG